MRDSNSRPLPVKTRKCLFFGDLICQFLAVWIRRLTSCPDFFFMCQAREIFKIMIIGVTRKSWIDFVYFDTMIKCVTISLERLSYKIRYTLCLVIYLR